MARYFDLQRYAVHDGPGIRTLVFLKGCPLRCAWCANPESQSFGPELRHRQSRCSVCLLCAAACQRQAIAPAEDRDQPLIIARTRCEACGAACVEACPQDALERVGLELDVGELVARIAADVDFYRNSGGGVTFSGGEPFAQPQTLHQLLKECAERGIHRAVETCGHVAPEVLRRIAPLVDLFLYDIKLVDPKEHERYCGMTNDWILENLRWLAEQRAEHVVVRVPLVPDVNDGAENLSAIASLMKMLGLRRAELQPYHALGTLKYAELGRQCLMSAAPPDVEALQAAVDIFANHAVEATV